MIRERFEESVETLNKEVLLTIRRHFDSMSLQFDLDGFIKRNACFLDHVVAEAHFEGAEVFPIDIPLKITER